jgi:Xaa-Pro aminopeptidase
VSTRSIEPARYAERLADVQQELPEQDAAAMLVGVGADLQWLTGYARWPSERLTVLVLPAEGRATLLVPRLELPSAEACAAAQADLLELVSWEETDDPFALVAGLLQERNARPEIQLGALGGTWGRLGGLLVSDRLWASFLLRLQGAVPDAAFGLASTVLGPLRAVKDAAEIELLRRAAAAADRVIASTAAGRLIGRTEADVAHEIRERLVTEGHDEATFAIVAAGPNSASPHHEPGSRLIEVGEPIVIDIGGQLEGYCSDTTRTVWVGGAADDGPDAEFRALHDVLERAQAEARRAVAPGVSCESIDAVAREVIAAAGYGDAFIHRTGHGIGLEGHEEPYLVAGNETPLAVGNCFSIEPGIYLAGRYGARIEDIVVCGQAAGESLNQSPRELLVVHGT